MTAEARAGEPALTGGASSFERRFARFLTFFATVAFGATALDGSAAPLLAGHYAASASVGIVADNMLRWHIPWPVWSYTLGPPSADLAYGHHPWGIFWTSTAIVAAIGRSDFACRLAPILLSTATIPMVSAVGSRLYRPIAGAVAALVFAALPISLAFASFNALEVPVIAWSVLSLWGFLGLWSTPPRRRDAVAFVLGALFAAECDWPGFLTAGALVGGGLAAIVGRPALRAGPGGALRRNALLGAAVLLFVALATQILWLRSIGKWNDLLFSYDIRSAGKETPILRVLASRRFWLELSFTKLGLALGAVALPLMVWRAARRRRLLELAPIALGITAVLQYVIFRQGADVHVFWPQHFAPFIALGAAAAVATACEVALASHSRHGPRLFWGAPALALLGTMAIARDGAAALRYARGTGGRFDEKGLLIHSDGDTIAAIRSALPLPGEGVIEIDASLHPHWGHTWALGRPSEIRAGFPDAACAKDRGSNGPSAWLADVRFLPPDTLREVVTQCATRVIGPLLVVEPGPWQPLRGSRLDEHAPIGLDGYLRGGSEPVRTVVPDPYGAWELQVHLDESSSDPELPATEPETADELRIAWSAAMRYGHAEAEARWSARLRPRIRPIDAVFSDGTRILGAIDAKMPGQATVLLVRAAGRLPRGVELSVTGTLVEAMPLSLTMPDPHRREMAMPPRIPPTLWRAGWVYPIEVFIHPRPGVEELRATLRSWGADRAPRLESGEADVVVARVSSAGG